VRLAAALLLTAACGFGQPKAGDRVRALIDLPADDSGVEAPGEPGAAVDRVRKYGVGVARGALATVTLVKRSGDHFELHLNGGGFTNREWLALPGYDSSKWGTTDEERSLRGRIIGTRDKARRRRLESQYDTLRRRRVKPLRDAYERELRSRRGSRINVKLPENATPEAWAAALQGFLDRAD
jgi:hypothetical protein